MRLAHPNHVLVKVQRLDGFQDVEGSDKTIYLELHDHNPPVMGKVLAVGDDVKKVSVGQDVLFRRFSGTMLPVAEADLQVFDQDDIQAEYVP
jgi:co-chaperonin GroES (HSP10)